MGHGVAGLAGAEEGLVVVVGQLGQAGHELLHRQVLLWPASSVETSRGQRLTDRHLRGGRKNLLRVIVYKGAGVSTPPSQQTTAQYL